jgi:hypothetical protein
MSGMLLSSGRQPCPSAACVRRVQKVRRSSRQATLQALHPTPRALPGPCFYCGGPLGQSPSASPPRPPHCALPPTRTPRSLPRSLPPPPPPPRTPPHPLLLPPTHHKLLQRRHHDPEIGAGCLWHGRRVFQQRGHLGSCRAAWVALDCRTQGQCRKPAASSSHRTLLAASRPANPPPPPHTHTNVYRAASRPAQPPPPPPLYATPTHTCWAACSRAGLQRPPTPPAPTHARMLGGVQAWKATLTASSKFSSCTAQHTATQLA